MMIIVQEEHAGTKSRIGLKTSDWLVSVLASKGGGLCCIIARRGTRMGGKLSFVSRLTSCIIKIIKIVVEVVLPQVEYPVTSPFGLIDNLKVEAAFFQY